MNTQTHSNDMIAIATNFGIDQSTSESILKSFLPFLEQTKQWAEKAKSLVVTDESQKSEMQMARTARLALKNIRVDADKIRKTLKEDSIRYGKAVQDVYNAIESRIKPIELYLEEQEKFVEIREQKRVAALKVQREQSLAGLEGFYTYGMDFGAMTDEQFSEFKTSAENAKRQADMEQKQKEENDRMERERIAQIQKENEVLKEKLEAIKSAPSESQRMESEVLQNCTTDKEKLREFIRLIKQTPRPVLNTIEGASIMGDILKLIGKIESYVAEKTNEI